MRRQHAVITVFFCLLSVIFLAFGFAVVEAVRMSGARAQCANMTSLGLWSVFSEYDNILLEDYGLFAVDAAYGGEKVSGEQLAAKLSSYVKENEKVTSEVSAKLPGLLLDPWKVSANQVQVGQYALLTDRGGEYYYQQAVEYMAKTAWADALGQLQDAYRDAEGIRQAESEFENGRKTSANNTSSMGGEIEAAKHELTTYTEVDEEGNVTLKTDQAAVERVNRAQEEGKKHDPTASMDELKNGDLLSLVCGNIKLSRKKIDGSDLLSKRRADRGLLSLDAPRGGMLDDLLFREYLMDHFRNFKDGPGDEALLYQAEYLIGGKYVDQENLKKTVRSLIYLREGANYAFLLANPARHQEAEGLAGMIIGWTGSVFLVETLKHALLLQWAYAESLYDVRIMLHDGRIPLHKTDLEWRVPLSALMKMKTYLRTADGVAEGGTTGLQYEDYLRLLLNLMGISKLKSRSLDLIELNLRTVCGCPSFRADHCVIGMTVKTDWNIPSIFGKVPGALLGAGDLSSGIHIDGGFAYR
ncbi:MAG TPA: hypothetical protein DHV42_02685 [Lachnospiraceae bacterium]|nr:hypothetical protein [Lachnospiraceae bacterium]